MIFVRQKFKHCAVACLVSALEDKRLEDLQTSIVQRFPKELQADTNDEGVPKLSSDFDAIAIALGLAKRAVWLDDFQKIKSNLIQNKHAKLLAFLSTTKPTNHFLRIKVVYDVRGLELMNPESGFEWWDWKKVEDSAPYVCFLLES